MIVGPSVKDLGHTRMELLITLSQRTRSQSTGASIASVLLTAVMLCLNDTLSPRQSQEYSSKPCAWTAGQVRQLQSQPLHTVVLRQTSS